MPADPRVVTALEAAGIAHRVMECDPELADTAAFCDHYGVAPEASANAIVMASRKPEGHHAVCVVLATQRLDGNGTVRKRMGVRKVSFASADVTRDITGMAIGGVTIAGLPDNLPVWVDPAVTAVEEVVVGAGTRSAKLFIPGSQILDLPNVEVVEGLAKYEVPDG